MAYDSVPFVQSVLYRSPYSGCCRFSGWPPAPCVQPPGRTFPSPYNAPGAILCAERYPKTWKAHGTPIKPIQLPPSPVRMGAPTQQGRFTIAGPSSKGPFTYADIYGICWGGTGPFGRISSGAPGQNLGLG